MATMTLRAEGPGDVDEVWRRYVTPSCWSSWSPQIRGVRMDGDGVDRVRAGSRGEVVSVFGVTAVFVVEAVDEGARRWVWRVRVGPVRMRLWHEVVGRRGPGGGAATTLRVEGHAVVLAAYALPARVALARLVRT